MLTVSLRNLHKLSVNAKSGMRLILGIAEQDKFDRPVPHGGMPPNQLVIDNCIKIDTIGDYGR